MHRILNVLAGAVIALGCGGVPPISGGASEPLLSRGWETRESCSDLPRDGRHAEIYVAASSRDLAFQFDGGPAVRLPRELSALRALRRQHRDRALIVLAMRTLDGAPASPDEIEAVAELASSAGWPVSTVCRTPAPERPPGSQETPPAREVMLAMNSVSAAVSACSPAWGTLQTRIVFRGNDGGVESVSFPERAPDPSVEHCIRRALRPLRLPPFARETYSVSYPFRL